MSLESDDSLDNDDDVDHLLFSAFKSLSCEDKEREQRAPAIVLQRLYWEEFLQKYHNRTLFKRHLRMHPESFNKLLDLIRPELEVNNVMAALRGGAIKPELRLYCAIRWLAGGSYTDICIGIGISQCSFYRVCWETIQAIINCEALSIRFPQGEEELKKAASGFSAISYNEAITNCIGVIDGFLMEITKDEAPNNKWRCCLCPHGTFGVRVSWFGCSKDEVW